MITVSDLNKFYGRTPALAGVNFTLNQGQALALWGSNGAGKTTLLKCLLGIVHFEGKIRILGMDVRSHGKKVRSIIGYVPQDVRLFPDLTVSETLLFFARLRGVRKERIEPVLRDWGLAAEMRKRVQELSGGMRQKLGLSAALLSDPPILFLDEPTSNLDEAARNDFESSMLRLKRAGKTLIFCSHRMGEVQNISDRVLTLEKGAQK